MVGAVIAVEPSGAAEFGDQHDYRLTPGLAHIRLDRGNCAVERSEQIGKPALDYALVDVGVPAVEGERADPRTLRLGEEFGRGAGGVGEVGANLRDAAALDHRALVARLAVHAADLRDRRKPDALLEHARKGRVGMAVEV